MAWRGPGSIAASSGQAPDALALVYTAAANGATAKSLTPAGDATPIAHRLLPYQTPRRSLRTYVSQNPRCRPLLMTSASAPPEPTRRPHRRRSAPMNPAHGRSGRRSPRPSLHTACGLRDTARAGPRRTSRDRAHTDALGAHGSGQRIRRLPGRAGPHPRTRPLHRAVCLPCRPTRTNCYGWTATPPISTQDPHRTAVPARGAV